MSSAATQRLRGMVIQRWTHSRLQASKLIYSYGTNRKRNIPTKKKRQIRPNGGVQAADTDPEKKLKTKQVPLRDANPLTATDQTLGWVGLVALKLSRNTDVNAAFSSSGNVYAINYKID